MSITHEARFPEWPDASLEGSYGPLRRRLLFDAGVYGVVRLAANASLLAMLSLLAHTLGPSAVGRYTLVLNTAWLVGMVWFGWCGYAAFRFSVQHQREGSLDEMRANLARFQLLLGAGVVAASLVVVLAMRTRSWTVTIVVASIILLATSGPAQSNIELLRMDGRPRAYAAMSLTLSLLPLALLALAFLVFSPSIEQALGVQAAVTSVVFAALALVWIRRADTGANQMRAHGRTFWSYGWPLIGGGALTWVLAVADRYLIGVFEGSADVGVYTAGYQIGTAPMWFLYLAVMMPLEPLIFGAHEAGDRTRAGEQLGKAFALIVASGTLLLIILAVERDFFVRLLVGTGFEDAGAVIPLVALGCLFLNLATVTQQRFVLTNDTKPIAQGLAIAAVANIVLNVMLIPVLSIFAAAIATAVGYLIFLVFLTFRASSRYDISIPGRWLAAAPVSALAAAVYVILLRQLELGTPWTPVLEVAGVSVTYSLVFLASAGSDFKRFLGALRRGGPALSP